MNVDGFDLQQRVRRIFNPTGALSSIHSHFMAREGQTEMALAVASTIEAAGVLVVEAGTGVGKTYAYLIPALLSGRRVLLSTATKALQDQLYGRDLPTVMQALGLPARVALLKGRSNYVCTYRLRMGLEQTPATDIRTRLWLSKIQAWSLRTASGDISELTDSSEYFSGMEWATSTKENCLGSQCPDFQNCFLHEARKRALASDVVVVNHHLFFADVSVRESGMAELLPTMEVLIFDEAHQLNEIGIMFLGRTLGTSKLLDLRRDILASGLQWARGLVDWPSLCLALERSAQDLRLIFGNPGNGTRFRWGDMGPEGCNPDEWVFAMQQMGLACTHVMNALDTVSEMAPDFVRLHERVTELVSLIEAFLNVSQKDHVRWVEIGHQLKLVESPLDVADTMRAKFMRLPSAPSEQKIPDPSWIFTSATLGDDASLSWFTQPMGLSEAPVLRVSSPFDYASQSLLFVPQQFSKPNERGHSAEVAALAAQGAQLLGGKTLVLTTSLKALNVIADILEQTFHDTGDVEVLVQGRAPKRVLMDRFREDGKVTGVGCVLVASASFWEGFDVPGDALQLLVIDKLPFPSPSDPLVEARGLRLQSMGKSSFNQHALPEAIVALKQGAGRLIRTELDKGALVICDTRLVTTGYGQRMLRALPPMKRVADLPQLWTSLQEMITKFSTKGV